MDDPDCVYIANNAPPTIPTNHTKKINQPGGVPYFTVARHVRQTCTPLVSSVSQKPQRITSFVLFSILKNPIKFDSYRPVLNGSDLRLFFVKCSKKKRHLSKYFLANSRFFMDLKLYWFYLLSNKRSRVTHSDQAFGLCYAIRDKGCSAPEKRSLHPKFRLLEFITNSSWRSFGKASFFELHPKSWDLELHDLSAMLAPYCTPSVATYRNLRHLTPYYRLGFLIAGLMLIIRLSDSFPVGLWQYSPFSPTRYHLANNHMHMTPYAAPHQVPDTIGFAFRISLRVWKC